MFLVLLERLMEPKKELIERVVKVIGSKKALELLSETATIEQTGGLYTVVRNEFKFFFIGSSGCFTEDILAISPYLLWNLFYTIDYDANLFPASRCH